MTLDLLQDAEKEIGRTTPINKVPKSGGIGVFS